MEFSLLGWLIGAAILWALILDHRINVRRILRDLKRSKK